MRGLAGTVDIERTQDRDVALKEGVKKTTSFFRRIFGKRVRIVRVSRSGFRQRKAGRNSVTIAADEYQLRAGTTAEIQNVDGTLRIDAVKIGRIGPGIGHVGARGEMHDLVNGKLRKFAARHIESITSGRNDCCAFPLQRLDQSPADEAAPACHEYTPGHRNR